MDGSRTHRGPQRDPPPVLKTGKPTGTSPLPLIRIPYEKEFSKEKIHQKNDDLDVLKSIPNHFNDQGSIKRTYEHT